MDITLTPLGQLNTESHFHNDLGLDSLDTVEVVMAIEEVSLHRQVDLGDTDGCTGIQH
jgi:acyl carrier protein